MVGVRISLLLLGKKYSVMKRLFNYIKEAYQELVHKVSWPTFKELQSSTIVVMVASLIIAMVVLCMDLAFENLMKSIYSILYKL